MKKLNDKIIGFAFVAIIIIISYAAYSVFSGFSEPVKAATLAALVAIISPYVNNYLQKNREFSLKLRENKIKTYETMQQHIFSIVRLGKENVDIDEYAKKSIEVNHAIIAGASPDVLFKYYRFFNFMRNQSENATSGESILAAIQIREMLADVLIAMRRDIGFSPIANEREMIKEMFFPLNFDPQNISDA